MQTNQTLSVQTITFENDAQLTDYFNDQLAIGYEILTYALVTGWSKPKVLATFKRVATEATDPVAEKAIEPVAAKVSIPTAPALPTMISKKLLGTVKWYDNEKGFGFISPADGSKDVFVHFSNVNGHGYSQLNEGQKVSFEKIEGRRGFEAADVSLA